MQAWERILDHLEAHSSPESFNSWLRPLECNGLDARGVLCLTAPNSSVRQLLEDEYKALILRAASDLGEPIAGVEIAAAAGAAAAGPVEPMQTAFVFKDRACSFNNKYLFESFVVGSCNEFAHAAAQAVAANPARSYNPLYVYGGVGMGKTHLMHAIGQQLSSNYPRMKVVYVSSEEFMNEMISSLRYDRMTSFHERFRTADALLVDDIQVLGSKERTQEEFFHTFNALHNMQKQIVLSSDLPPKQLPGLVDRLRSRFSWGLIADIQPPDLETKMAILDRKAEETGVSLPDSVRAYLATNLKSNIRELEGALIRLIAISSVSNTDINLAMAKQALKSIIGESQTRPNAQAIQKAVAAEYGLEPGRLREKSNAKAVAFPRQVAMYLCKEILGLSLPEIGRAFGGKHHTTVLHSISKIDRLLETDRDLKARIHKLTDRFA